MRSWSKSIIDLVAMSLAVLLVVSCEEEVELDLPVPAKLVLLSNFSPDNLFRVYVGTNSALDAAADAQDSFPSNATIRLYENEELITGFRYREETSFFASSPYYESNFKPKAGQAYRIELSVPNYPLVSAENAIPESSPIENVELLTSELSMDPSGLMSYDITAELSLPANLSAEQNFHLVLWQNIRNYYLNGNDTIFDDYRWPISFTLINDIESIEIFHEEGTLFEGKALQATDPKIELSFFVQHDPYFEIKQPLTFEWRNASEDYFRFHSSTGRQEAVGSSANLFSIPSSAIYNNVQGGLGNFSGYNSSSKELAY